MGIMKQNKEIINWFNNYFDNCYYVKHDEYPDSIFMFYDINYVRQKKLAKLEGKNIEKTDITGICVFEQEWKYKWLCCNYDLIWKYLRDNYSFNYDDFQEFIKDRLEEHSKMNVLNPVKQSVSGWIELEEHSKMNILTPNRLGDCKNLQLKEYSKLSILTHSCKLDEHSKLSELAPYMHILHLNYNHSNETDKSLT